MLNVVWTQGVTIKGEAAGLGKDGVSITSTPKLQEAVKATVERIVLHLKQRFSSLLGKWKHTMIKKNVCEDKTSYHYDTCNLSLSLNSVFLFIDRWRVHISISKGSEVIQDILSWFLATAKRSADRLWRQGAGLSASPLLLCLNKVSDSFLNCHDKKCITEQHFEHLPRLFGQLFPSLFSEMAVMPIWLERNINPWRDSSSGTTWTSLTMPYGRWW